MKRRSYHVRFNNSKLTAMNSFYFSFCYFSSYFFIFLVSCSSEKSNESSENNMSMTSTHAPSIQHLEWGRVTISMPNGHVYVSAEKEDLAITPEGYKPWDYKKFGSDLRKKGESEIRHLWPEKPKSEQGTGILPYAIKALLCEASGSNIVVIVSTGMDGALGVSPLTESYLKELKIEKRIEDFYILNSRQVPGTHNNCVEAGKRVYTLLHSTC